MIELLAQMEEVVSIVEEAEGYVVEIDDSEGMSLALDQLLDELEESCLAVIDEHEFGQSYVFDGFEIAVLFVGDYD